jgi:hypothetical protein
VYAGHLLGLGFWPFFGANCRRDSLRAPLTRSDRSPDWLKMKNPACAAVTREAEEDWGR